MRSNTRFSAFGAVAAGLALAATSCASPTQETEEDTEEVEELPDEVTMIMPYPEGGGTDTWGRFFGPWLEETVEGNPSFIPENREGGEAITGTNQFVQDGVTDGSEVMVSSATQHYHQILGRPEVEYDFAAMRPLIVNPSGGMIYGSVDEGVESLEDLEDADLSYGGIAATGLDLSTLLAFEVLELDVDVTLGFEGRADAATALQRGEVSIDYQTTSAYLSQIEPLVEDGDVAELMSLGQLDENGEVVRDPVKPDLPHVGEVYEEMHGEEPSGPAWDAYMTFLATGASFQKVLWAPEGTPDAVVDFYTDAVNELNENEDFLAEGEEILGGYEVFAGADVQDQLLESFEISEEAETYVMELLEDEYDTTIDGA